MSDSAKVGAAKAIVRKTYEFPSELDARIKVASRARGVSESVLVRTVLTDWLINHTIAPTFQPPPLEVSAEAYAASRKLGTANAGIAAVFDLPPGAKK